MKMKRVLVTFTQEQWDRIERIKPEVGLADAEAVRTIVVTWLIDKGYLANPPREEVTRADELRRATRGN